MRKNRPWRFLLASTVVCCSSFAFAASPVTQPTPDEVIRNAARESVRGMNEEFNFRPGGHGGGWGRHGGWGHGGWRRGGWGHDGPRRGWWIFTT